MKHLALCLVCAATAMAADDTPQVIYSESPGHPTASVPGAIDASGKPVDAEFKALELLSVSSDGVHWIVKGRSHLEADLDTMLMRGTYGSGSVFAQEAQPIPGGAEGEVYDFFGSGPARFDSQGRFVYTARARGGDGAIAHKGFHVIGDAISLVREQGDPALGLLDLPPNPSGDELFGNSFGSMHLLDDGRIGYQDSTIQNIHSFRRPAIFYGDTAFRQSGVSLVGGAVWDSFDSNDFMSTTDGETWLALGDDDNPTTNDDILVVNDEVVLREGTLLKGTEIQVDGIFDVRLVENGDWLARGDDPANDDWAVRNGTLLAATGTSITTGTEENWADVILAISANRAGHWMLAGKSDNPDVTKDDVLVLDGTTVIAREGDPIDLDGNGLFDDDAFIGRGNATSSAFHPDDLLLADNGFVYFFASLRNAAGEDLGEFGSGGDAFLRQRVLDLCPGDLTGEDEVGFADLLTVLSNWGPCPGPDQPCAADLDDSGDVGFGDLLIVLSNWGPCVF